MAAGVKLATAYVQIVASASGVRKDVAKELNLVAGDAEKTGRSSGKKMSAGLAKGVDAKGFRKRVFSGVDKDAAGAGKKAGGRFKTGMSSALKGFGAGLFVGVGADQLVGLFKDATKGASDLEQSVGGVQAVFKDFAPQIERASKQAAQNLGLSRDEYNKLATTLGAGLKNKGIEDYAGSTQNLIEIGGDLAAQFGGSTQEAVEALSSAMRGESDPIEKYGVALNETAVNAKLAEMGVKKAGGTYTEQQKTMARLALITEQTADAQGAFGRESETAAGRQAILSASFENIKTTIGTALLPAFSGIVNSVSDFVSGMDQGTGAGGRFKEIAIQVKDAVMGVVDFVTKYKDVIIPLAGGILAVVAAMKTWKMITTAVTAVQTALNVVMSANPIGLIVLAIVGLVAALVLAYKNSETFRDIVNGAWAAVKSGIGSVVNWFTGTAWPALKGAFEAIGNAAKWLWTNAIKPAFNAIWGIAKSVFGWIKDTGWPMLKGALSAIGSAAMWLWTNAIKPAFGFIWGIVKSVFGWIKNTGWPWVKTALDAIGKAAMWLWTNAIKPYFSLIWGIVKKVFGWIKNTGWPWMKTALDAIGSAAKTLWTKWIKPNFDRIKSGAQAIVGAFRSARDGIGKAFSALKDKIAGPIRTVLSWIDKNFISKVKSMLHSVNLGDLSKKIPYLTPGGKGYARGGWTGPGSTYTPAGVVHADEFVVKKSSRRRFEQENPGLLDHVNRTGTLAGYAMGGKVGGLNTAFRRALDRFNEAAGGRFSVLSGLRTRAEQAVLYQRYLNGTGNLAARPGTSRHETGDAADLVPSTARDTHGALARRFGLHFPVPGEPWHVELINGGKGGGAGGFFSGLLGKVMEKGASAVKALLDKFAGDGSPFQRFAIGAMKMASDDIAKLIQRGGNEMTAGDGGLGSKFQSLATGTNVNIGRSMAASRGWTGQQWLALKELWTRESNWNHRAINPSSGAYGIPQALPASKMASAGKDWRINPATQIAWGLGYIKQRYGTPAAALAWHNSHNWYAGGGLVKQRPAVFDNGGVLAPGLNLVHNKLGRPEPLIRPEHALSGPIYATFRDTDGVLLGTIRGEIDTARTHDARLGGVR